MTTCPLTFRSLRPSPISALGDRVNPRSTLRVPLALLLLLTHCTQKPVTPTAPGDDPAQPGRPPGDAPADPAPARTCPVDDPQQQCNYLRLFRTDRDFADWTRAGVQVGPDPVDPMGQARVRLSPGSQRLSCQAADIDGGVASFNEAVGLCEGRDPLPRGGYLDGQSYYNGGTFYFGTLVSPVIATTGPLDHLIPSFVAATPAGTWIELRARVRRGDGNGQANGQDRWTRWYSLGVWAGDFSTVRRHSVTGQADTDGAVDTDTLSLKTGPGLIDAAAYQIGVTLFSTAKDESPVLRRLAIIASRDGQHYAVAPPDRSVWGTELPVPQRSQELPEYKGQDYGGGGEVWCSPTSTSMIMAYYAATLSLPALLQTVPAAAAGCYDMTYKGTGNWPFNTAYAASFDLVGLVTRMDSMTEAERWIKAGVPLVISIAFKAGEPPWAPISKTNGHLIVLRGFSPTGDVIANDPAAASDERVRVVYPRAALEAAWAHSHRTAYVIYPRAARSPVPIAP